MPLVTDLDLPEFDYLDPALRGPRFHEVLKELHQKSWLARSSFAYFVFDRRVIAELLRDRQLASPLRAFLQLLGITDQGWLDWRLKGAVQSAVGSDHSKLRHAAAAAFTPKAIDRLRRSMREMIAALWRQISARGRCEFVSDYALRLPAMAIAELLGVPAEQERLARGLSRWAGCTISEILMRQPRLSRPRRRRAHSSLTSWLSGRRTPGKICCQPSPSPVNAQRS